MLDRDEQIRAAREDTLKVQRTLEEQLAEERAAHQDLQVQNKQKLAHFNINEKTLSCLQVSDMAFESYAAFNIVVVYN